MSFGNFLLVADGGAAVAVLWALACTGGALAIGSAFRILFAVRHGWKGQEQRLRSLATWWALYLVLALAVLGGPRVVVVLVAGLSVLGLWEYRGLMRQRELPLWTWPAVFAVAFAHYGALYWGRLGVAPIGTPLAALAISFLLIVSSGRRQGLIRTAAPPLVGLVLMVYCPSHAAILASHTPAAIRTDGGPGSFLYLVLLTEIHDIAQAVWGRTMGKRKIAPRISPGKTWEGFLLGTATTVCLAMLLMPLWISTGEVPSPSGGQSLLSTLLLVIGAGLVIAVSGFFGDLCMSAIKRDSDVKDSGNLLPGQGGVLDRIDSLTLAAPAFYGYTLAVAWYVGEGQG